MGIRDLVDRGVTGFAQGLILHTDWFVYAVTDFALWLPLCVVWTRDKNFRVVVVLLTVLWGNV